MGSSSLELSRCSDCHNRDPICYSTHIQTNRLVYGTSVNCEPVSMPAVNTARLRTRSSNSETNDRRLILTRPAAQQRHVQSATILIRRNIYSTVIFKFNLIKSRLWLGLRVRVRVFVMYILIIINLEPLCTLSVQSRLHWAHVALTSFNSQRHHVVHIGAYSLNNYTSG